MVGAPFRVVQDGGIDHRHEAARAVEPLFQRAVVNDEVEILRVEAELIHQCGRLRRRAKSGPERKATMEEAFIAIVEESRHSESAEKAHAGGAA